VRATAVLRELDREPYSVEIDGQPVTVKVGRMAGRMVNLAPEHDDVARGAAALGRPAKTVWAQAWAAAEAALDED
jgi:hypothetical protein